MLKIKEQKKPEFEIKKPGLNFPGMAHKKSP